MNVFWIAAIIIFVIIEAATPQLVTIWFAIGAIGGLIASLLGAEVIVQLIVFTLISLLLLIFTRSFVKKVLKPRNAKTNADRLIGTTAVVTEEINNILASGQVKASGQEWTARTEENIVIPVEELVTILRIEGVKLIVETNNEKSNT